MKSINLLFILLFASKTFSQIASLSNTIDPKEFDKVMDTQVIPSNISGNYVIYASRPGSYSQDLTLVNPETGTIGKKISLPEYDSYKLFYNEGFSPFVSFKNSFGIIYSKKSGKGIELAASTVNESFLPSPKLKSILYLPSSEYVVSEISDDQSIFVIGTARLDKEKKVKVYSISAFDKDCNKAYSASLIGDEENKNERFTIMAFNDGAAISLAKQSSSQLKIYRASAKVTSNYNLAGENKLLSFSKIRKTSDGKLIACGLYGINYEESYAGVFKAVLNENEKNLKSVTTYVPEKYAETISKRLFIDNCNALVMDDGSIYMVTYIKMKKDISDFYFSLVGINEKNEKWDRAIPVSADMNLSKQELSEDLANNSIALVEYNKAVYLFYNDYRIGEKAEKLDFKAGDMAPMSAVPTRNKETHQNIIKTDNKGKLELSSFEGVYADYGKYSQSTILFGVYKPVLGYFYPNKCAIFNFKLK